MRLIYVSVPGRGETDTFISELVATLTGLGVRLACAVRSSDVDDDGHPCDMDMRVLPDGTGFRISQPLGRMAKGCRLDGGVIEAIAAGVKHACPEPIC